MHAGCNCSCTNRGPAKNDANPPPCCCKPVNSRYLSKTCNGTKHNNKSLADNDNVHKTRYCCCSREITNAGHKNGCADDVTKSSTGTGKCLAQCSSVVAVEPAVDSRLFPHICCWRISPWCLPPQSSRHTSASAKVLRAGPAALLSSVEAGCCSAIGHWQCKGTVLLHSRLL